MPNTDKGVVAQVQKLVRDRAHLRAVISSMLAINRDAPGVIKAPIAEQLEKAMTYTDD